jgi:hypothetical protein
MVSEEPFNKTTDEYFKDAGKAYELESFDKDSLSDIRKSLDTGGYKDPVKLRDHMEYVEELIQRLSRTLEDEAKEEIANLSLKHELIKIKELYGEMSRLLDKLEGAEIV